MTEPAERACCAPALGGVDRAAAATGRHRAAAAPVPHDLVAVAGGTFAMGDHHGEGYPADGETPVHPVALSAYAVATTTVTNDEFASFVAATGHRTDAEELGVSAVFHLAVEAPADAVLGRVAGTPWWLAVRGADWRHPAGPASGVDDRADHPVVHVSWRDATAYCAWAGVRLPTEAEWEHAARGGLAGARFAWGTELTPGGRWPCNIWQGRFPESNTGDDGHLTTAPVRSYEPNGLGLWQTGGNVWEWCADWFSAGTYADRAARLRSTGAAAAPDPRGPSTGSARVMRGGSYLCHDSYCHRYRVSARSSNTPDSAAANIGFRVAADSPAPRR